MTGNGQHNYHPNIYLVGGLEHVLFFHFFHILGIIVTPTDELIFFRGVGRNHQPDLDP